MSNRNATESNSRSDRDDRSITVEARTERAAESRTAETPAKPSVAPASGPTRPNLPALVRKRPLAPSTGTRPIEPSHLDLVESNLPGHRPVAASPLKLSGTVSSYGIRPIGVSDMKVAQTITLSGNRPVLADTLVITSTDWLPGNRPVASNDLGEDSNLMGFLD